MINCYSIIICLIKILSYLNEIFLFLILLCNLNDCLMFVKNCEYYIMLFFIG